MNKGLKQIDGGKVVLYKNKVEVQLKEETVWLSQKQMAELFDKDRKTITWHIQNVFKDGELVEASVCLDSKHTEALMNQALTDKIKEGESKNIFEILV